MIRALAWLDRHAGRVLAATLLILLAVALMAISGCGSRTYLEALADVRAGAQAAQQATDASARATLLAAVGRRVVAITDRIPDLPAPLQTPAEIVADPAAYAATAVPAPAYQSPPPAPPAPWARWLHLGDHLVFWGGIVGAIGSVLWLVASVAGWFGWAGGLWPLLGSPAAAAIARLCAAYGGGAALVGGGLVWAATYWWAVVLAAVLAGGVLAACHRRDISRLWARLCRTVRSGDA